MKKDNVVKKEPSLKRNPDVTVKRALRKEVVFGCPVENCGCPYLEWHHFDPPWKDEQHHDPNRMIALCRTHHIQADAGAFTKEQLYEMKKNAADNWKQVSGKFSWMRNKLLGVVGGNFYYGAMTVLKVDGEPVIWFERDDSGYLLLNFKMLTATGEPRVQVINNEWLNTGGEADIECPPSGRKLRVSYLDGDNVSIEFFEIKNIEGLLDKYSGMKTLHERFLSMSIDFPVEFPVTVVEVKSKMVSANVNFALKKTKIGKGIELANNFIAGEGGCMVDLKKDL